VVTDPATTIKNVAIALLKNDVVDAVPARRQEPGWVDVYVQDYWRKRYVLYLLAREEMQDLARSQN